MIAHTPAPWTRGDAYDRGETYAICAGLRVVARIVGTGYPIGIGRSPESDANARLIAAAPDLLAALRAVVAHLDQPVVHTSTGDRVAAILRGDSWAAMRVARAAIAKATE